jgi:hypothetical protein
MSVRRNELLISVANCGGVGGGIELAFPAVALAGTGMDLFW